MNAPLPTLERLPRGALTLFRMARLQIYTAAGSGADGEIPGLTRETAEALRERLVRREADDVV